MMSLLKKLSIGLSIKIGVIKLYGVCLVSFQILSTESVGSRRELVFTPQTPTRQNSFVASASAVCIGHYTADVLPLIEGHGLLFSRTSMPMTRKFTVSVHRISVCINEVAAWMRSNRLQLNTTKTEILWSTTGCRLQQLPQLPLRVCPDQIAPATFV